MLRFSGLGLQAVEPRVFQNKGVASDPVQEMLQRIWRYITGPRFCQESQSGTQEEYMVARGVCSCFRVF